MNRVLLAWCLLITCGFALAESRVPASGEPIVIEGFTPGASYYLTVQSRVQYPGTVERPHAIARDACFEYEGLGLARGPGTPMAVFQNDFGVEVCGPDPRYRDGEWRALQRVEFVAPSTRMVAWMVTPDIPQRELEAQAWQSLQVFVQPKAWAGHTGPVPQQLDHCLLRRSLYRQQPTSGPPVCFEFNRAYAFAKQYRMVEVDFDSCRLTDYAVQRGYELDPNFGGPHGGSDRVAEAWWAVTDYSGVRTGGDYYGCRDFLGPPRPPPPAPDPSADEDDDCDGVMLLGICVPDD